MAEIAITQADRDAAVQWVRAWKGDARPDDPKTLPQAFARHRLTAEQAKDAEIERLREALVSRMTAAANRIAEATPDNHSDKKMRDYGCGLVIALADELGATSLDTILNRERDNATG